MKSFMHVFFLVLLSIQSYGQICNDVLHGCKELPLNADKTLSSYDELLIRKYPVECLTIRAYFFDDTACLNYTDLTKFKELKNIYIDFGKSDSVTQLKLLDDLKQIKSLQTLSLHTTFRHNYAGFDSLKKIWVNKFLLNNKSLTTLKKLEELLISTGDVKVLSTDPIFSIESIKTLEIRPLINHTFPYDRIGNFKNLETLIIQGPDSLEFYPHWNSLQNLKRIIIDHKGLNEVNFTSMDCEKLKNLTLIHFYGSYRVPTFDISIFSDTNLKIQLEIKFLGKSEERKIKKYAKKAEKKYNRKVTFISRKNDPVNRKTTLIIEGLKGK